MHRAGALLVWLRVVAATCPNLCSGHGACNMFSRCECNDGWEAADCSEYSCPRGRAWTDMPTATDTAHAMAECSNRGECDHSTGQCVCHSGFGGDACQRLSCASDCNGHGRCQSLEQYAGTTYNDDSVQYAYTGVWDADKTFGCVCDWPYMGHDCAQKGCPVGDDPLTTGQVNEVQLLYCAATSGSFVLYFEGQPSLSIKTKYNSKKLTRALQAIPRLADVEVTFSPDANGTVCQTSSINVISIEFKGNFGRLAPLRPYTGLLSGDVSVRAHGATQSDSNGDVYSSVTGTKESAMCSNRGLCDVTVGVCACYDTNNDAYTTSDGEGGPGTRGDCGYPMQTTTSSCPGEVACSSVGVCNDADETFKCDCAEGWQGGDCSERACPRGLSWFSYPTADDTGHDVMTECSDKGSCDRTTGMCTCADGFSGSACEYMGCPDACNGHGRCVSQSQMAELADVNGDSPLTATGSLFTYGADPNNPQTWDAQRIFGCWCDDGYEGLACADRVCPLGDDPGTYSYLYGHEGTAPFVKEVWWPQQNELQLIECLATGGTFDLTFRRAKAERIPYNATRKELKARLEDLTTIGRVAVKYSSGKSACSDQSSASTYNTIQVQFITEHGDVPAIELGADNLADRSNGGGKGTGTMSIAVDGAALSDDDSVSGALVSVVGTTENEPCSNRGLCDRTTGRCMCFPGYSSSDGLGKSGDLDDCGYVMFDRTVAGA